MTVAHRIRLISGAYIVACLALIHGALWSMPDEDAWVIGRRLLYLLALALPIGIPVGITFFRRWTAAEVEAARPPTPSGAPAPSTPAGLTVDELLAIVRQSPLPIAIFDRDLRYLAHSDRWLSAYRLPSASLVGRLHYDVFPEVPGRWKVIHQQCLAGASKHSPGEPFPRQDGRTDWIRWTVQPWHDEQGAIGGLLMFTEVITAQKEAEQALATRLAELEEAHGRLEAATAVARLGYWTWHPTIGELEVSPGVQTLLQLGSAPTSMDELQRRIPPDELDLFLARLRRAVLRADRFSHQVTFLADDGTRLRVRLAARVERGPKGDAVRVFGVMLDASDALPPAGESAETVPDR